ncbi:MAG: HAMP domain-containing sensor histidine kinase [Tepidisphaeraceae bacterium]
MHRTPSDHPQIALTWLTRLRWLAVFGQIGATAFAWRMVTKKLPLMSIGIVIGATALTNLLVSRLAKSSPSARWLIPSVVMLDVLLLTAVLALTGAWQNPFCTLYVVHVAIAVVLLKPRWTWIVVATAAGCYALLFQVPTDPLTNGHALPAIYERGGQWLSLVLVMALIAYFVGRLQRSLRFRETELASVRDRAERSARFAAVTALAAGAAHELGSPLGTIAVVAKELEINATNCGAPADIIEDAKLIRLEVDRCRAILNRMRLEVGDDLRYKAGMISAADFIEGAMVDLRDDQKARLATEVQPGCESFWLNSRAVLRALGVMLRNAFEASKGDQPVKMRISRRDAASVDGTADPATQVRGPQIAVEVQDFGSGMAPDVLKRAGEPFFTTKEMGRGMGMGLFLVRLVAENNGGRVELKSEQGKGTLATLLLPAEPA